MKTFIISSLLLAVLVYQPGLEKDRRRRPVRTVFKDQTETASIDGFQARTFKNNRSETMPYRLFIPHNYNPKRKYPIVLWLHGGGGRGNDNLKQISGGNVDGTRVWVSAAAQQKNPVFVLAPQCPSDESWTTIEGVKSTRALAVALEVLASVEEEFSIDVKRRYVAGQSMGGLGTWSVITEHPGMFAAAIPVCGAGNESLASRLVRTPIWAFHGALDETVRVQRSRRMIEAIRQAGGDPLYTEYPNVGHNSWEPAFREPRLLEWVFAQKSSGWRASSNPVYLGKSRRRR